MDKEPSHKDLKPPPKSSNDSLQVKLFTQPSQELTIVLICTLYTKNKTVLQNRCDDCSFYKRNNTVDPPKLIYYYFYTQKKLIIYSVPIDIMHKHGIGRDSQTTYSFLFIQHKIIRVFKEIFFKSTKVL